MVHFIDKKINLYACSIERENFNLMNNDPKALPLHYKKKIPLSSRFLSDATARNDSKECNYKSPSRESNALRQPLGDHHPMRFPSSHFSLPEWQHAQRKKTKQRTQQQPRPFAGLTYH